METFLLYYYLSQLMKNMPFIEVASKNLEALFPIFHL